LSKEGFVGFLGALATVEGFDFAAGLADFGAGCFGMRVKLA
jgi:hypothetical protein